MKTCIETVTPAQAKKYMQLNRGNRVIRKNSVEKFVTMLRGGKWRLTHQGIAFADTPDGERLIDGQHRLLAIIEANLPARMLVARELEEEDYKYIDGGAPRTVADKLKFVDDPPLNRIVAALVSTRTKITVHSGGAAPTIDEVENEFLAFDSAYVAVAKAWTKKIKSVTRAEIGAALVSYAAGYPKKADQFAQQLIGGDNLYKGHPAFTLSEGLIQGRIGQGRPMLESYFKAINAMKSHLKESVLNSIMPATSDFQGNEYSSLRYELARKGVQSAETRKKQGGK